MKHVFAVFLSALVIGTPLISYAEALSTVHQGIRTDDHGAQLTATTKGQVPSVSPPIAGGLQKTSAKNWIEMRNARDWWKDN